MLWNDEDVIFARWQARGLWHSAVRWRRRRLIHGARIGGGRSVVLLEKGPEVRKVSGSIGRS